MRRNGIFYIALVEWIEKTRIFVTIRYQSHFVYAVMYTSHLVFDNIYTDAEFSSVKTDHFQALLCA